MTAGSLRERLALASPSGLEAASLRAGVLGLQRDPKWSDSRTLGWGLLVAIAVGIWAVFWPGVINPDSFETTFQASAQAYTNWWTPFGSWTLHLWENLGLGIGGVYAIPVIACICGLYMCVRFALRRVPAALVTLVVCWIPPDFAQLSGTSRDMYFLGFAVLGFGLLGRVIQCRTATRAGAAWLTVAAVAAEVVAYLSRQNGISCLIAALFVVLLCRRAARPTGWLRGRRGIVIAGITAVVVGGAMALVTIELESAAGVVNVYPQRVLYIYDLASISKLSGHDYFPPRLINHPIQGGVSPPYVHQGELDRLFNPYNIVSLYVGSFEGTIQFGNSRIARRENALLKPAWIHAVEHEPLDYAFERLRVLAIELGLWDNKAADAYLPVNSPDNYGYPLLSGSRYQPISNALLHLLGPYATFRFDILWIWMLVMMGCMVVLLRRERRHMRFIAVAPTGVVLNFAVLLVTTMGASYRYVNLVAPATLILMAYVVASYARSSRRWHGLVAPGFAQIGDWPETVGAPART